MAEEAGGADTGAAAAAARTLGEQERTPHPRHTGEGGWYSFSAMPRCRGGGVVCLPPQKKNPPAATAYNILSLAPQPVLPVSQ